MFNNIQVHANPYISFIFQTHRSLYLSLKFMWNLQKARVVQETRIPSPAVYFLLYMWYVSLSKITVGL